jgi:hypothetical protein
MPGTASLRGELTARSQQMATAHRWLYELTTGATPCVIFGRTENQQHGNFHPTSYRNICANPRWASRLAKVHSGYRKALPRADWRWKELDCANSSDALLMNIFCYRRTLSNLALSSLLGVASGLEPEFGFRPGIPLRNGKTDRTEIDLKLGDLLLEAKLTESGFQNAPATMLRRYRDLEEVFATGELVKSGDRVRHYQLIRGVLAAHSTGGSFCLLCDARRPDLIESWFAVLRAVENCALRCRLQLRTWQELARALPQGLRRFLAIKYGIAP